MKSLYSCSRDKFWKHMTWVRRSNEKFRIKDPNFQDTSNNQEIHKQQSCLLYGSSRDITFAIRGCNNCKNDKTTQNDYQDTQRVY